LLAGKVTKQHPLYAYMRRAGATERELGAFETTPCRVDTVGINYYVTSERFLDSRVALYPPHLIGGNARQRYMDVEAVRVCADGLVGPATILASAHARYRRPVVVSEAHLACSPGQQAAWLWYVWKAAQAARDNGADVRAVTVWALLGAFGWDRLVTAGAGNYEAGAFDVRHGEPAATPLVEFITRMVDAESLEVEPGWWTQQDRLTHPPFESQVRAA
jgi:dTDP-4-dehydrorhamnose reductase